MKTCVIGDMRSIHVRKRVTVMADLGHEMIVITPEIFGVEHEHVTEIPTPAPRPLPGILRKLQTLRVARATGRLARSQDCDVTHVHYARTLEAWAGFVGGQCPLMVSTMGADALLYEQGDDVGFFGRLLTSLLLRKSERVTVKSDHMGEVVRDLGVSPDRIMKVTWGVDPDIFHPVDPASLMGKLNIPGRGPIILSTRFIQPLYNIHIIVRAFALVRKKHPEARLLLAEGVVGDNYQQAIREDITGMGLDDAVVWLGRVDHADMPALYSLADVCVSLAASDAIPQTLVETMACGTPCVLTRLERYDEVVENGVSALYTDPEPEMVAAAVSRLLEDEEYRSEMAANALKTVRERLDIRVDAARVSEEYERLVKEYGNFSRSLWVRLKGWIWLTLDVLSAFAGKLFPLRRKV